MDIFESFYNTSHSHCEFGLYQRHNYYANGVIESPQGWEQDGSQQPVIILARSV